MTTDAVAGSMSARRVASAAWVVQSTSERSTTNGDMHDLIRSKVRHPSPSEQTGSLDICSQRWTARVSDTSAILTA